MDGGKTKVLSRRGTEAREKKELRVEQEVKTGPVLKERKRKNIGTQKVAKVTDPATSYSKIFTRLGEIEQTMHQMSRELNGVHNSSDISLGKNRNFVIHGTPEPFMKEGEQMEKAVRNHVVNQLRMVKLLELVAINRVGRLGGWEGITDPG